MRLRLLKAAPPVPDPSTDRWNRSASPDRCIAPGLMTLERPVTDPYRLHGGPGSHRCARSGSVPVRLPGGAAGVLCGNHARAYARRGWVNAQLLRRILEERAAATARRATRRRECLRAGRCI